MSEHPSPFALEQWHIKQQDTKIAQHLRDCNVCQDYVASLEDNRHLFLDGEKAEDVVRRLRIKEVESKEISRPTKFRWWVIAPVSAAVGAIVVAIISILPNSTLDPGTGLGLRIKGGLQIAGIVVREGKQSRQTTAFVVKPGDRIRIELTLPSRQVITVGYIEEGEKLISLVENREMDAGVHYVKQTLRIDSQPKTGWLIVGEPTAVQHAVKEKRFDEVSVLRLIAEEKH